ncbi:MAG: penicillin acylase family protein [Chloroflexota bacterium]
MGLNTSITRKDTEDALPDLESNLEFKGLDGTIAIHRDEFGIPHIQAESIDDAFFAQGFVHGQDRLWQMEFDRRRASGRWSEVAGKTGLIFDKFARRVGIARSAKHHLDQLNGETRAMLNAYSRGVNAFIESTSSLPIEYTIVGIEPEPWEAWHTVAVYNVRHILMGTGLSKLLRARSLHFVGPEFASKLRAESQGDEVLIVPPGEEYRASLADLSVFDPGNDAISRLAEFDAGSNNWVVHGDRTETGKPLVAGDSHRALDVPNVYYQMHLACPEFDVIGFSFLGVPGFPHFAHNAHVAWAITHAGADYQDLFVERFDPNDPGRYRFQDEWRSASRSVEKIDVMDGETEEVEIVETHHGPIVFGDPSSGAAIAYRYTATSEPNPGLQCFVPMLRARSVDEYDEAMRDWVEPGNNLVMADTDGNIAYLTRGKIPIRSEANFWLPVPGWTGEHEWQGMIPFEELPRSKNPDTGFIATANNRIVDDDYPNRIAIDFAPPSRAQRIIANLEHMTDATVDDMATVHADRISIPSAIFRGRLAKLSFESPLEQDAQRLVIAWNGLMSPDQSEPAIYIATRQHLTKRVAGLPVFERYLHNPFAAEEPPLVGPNGLLWFLTPGLLANDDPIVLPDDVTWDDLVHQAFRDAIAELREELGPDLDTWKWGDLHRTHPQHPLAIANPELAESLNPPSVSAGGDGDTPQAAAIYPTVNYRVAGTSVTRYIFDVADWDNSRWIVPLGSSGHPASPHWADQAERWSKVEYVPMRYSWDLVKENAVTTQTLSPGS